MDVTGHGSGLNPRPAYFGAAEMTLASRAPLPIHARPPFPINGVSGFSNRKPPDTRHHSLRTVPPRGLEAAPAKIFPIGKARLPRCGEIDY